jgi:hypothetical protein
MLTHQIDEGNLSQKPGWVRASIHPTTTEEEVKFMLKAVSEIVMHVQEWKKEYTYDSKTNEFRHQQEIDRQKEIEDWFEAVKVK